MNPLRPRALALVAAFFAAAVSAGPSAPGLVFVEDYGMGAFANIAAWQAAGAAQPVVAGIEPMDYGMGAFASEAEWRAAGVGGTQTVASVTRR